MTTTPRLIAALALLPLVHAVPAAAQQVATTADRELASPPPQRFWDARIGMLLGAADVGNSAGTSLGVTGGYGYHLGDFGIRGELSYYSVGDDGMIAMPRRGRGERASLLGRYSFASTASDNSFIADLWGEAGAGFERVEWATGGVLDRPDAELAVGLDLGARRDRDGSPGTRRRRVGYFMDVRSFVGEAPADPSAPAQCGGPCTMATTPPSTNVSVFFEFGAFWGR